MGSAVRAVLVVLLLLAAGVLLVGYMNGRSWMPGSAVNNSSGPVGTSGATATEKAREQGARIGEKAAEATAKVQETMSEAAITAKIKAKMALDDSVKARSIDVSTTGSTVTLRGVVRSEAEHDRAVALARETAGITRVVDHLAVER